MRARGTILIATVVLGMLSIAGFSFANTYVGDFCAGSDGQGRSSPNYVVIDTLGQFVVGASYAPDDSYSCGWVEHGFWHSDIHIPTVPEIKQIPNGQWVDTYAKVVSAGSTQFSKEFYISDADRTGAIRVNLGNQVFALEPGDMVDVSGVISGSTLDRYINYPLITPRFSNVPQIAPYFASNRWLGGKGIDVGRPGGSGVVNTSMLMKTCGIVTYVDTGTPRTFFYIDDGSGLCDGLVYNGYLMRGLRVALDKLATGNTITPPLANTYVTVTGICAPYSAGGKFYAAIRPRNQADIRSY